MRIKLGHYLIPVDNIAYVEANERLKKICIYLKYGNTLTMSYDKSSTFQGDLNDIDTTLVQNK